ncbi:Plasmodium exported protein, unknown function [Plasmodium vinckei vinckei]|uniref:Fam-b protein n=1 Tax=Plasmodium vinckei vinckei TaxID=54757 RepID=A0A449BNS8_PLAVN|nr:Plasmodium exported protein, unknown function [Plasmodium vinckei vinckei]VEV55107.1 Plasmodium exported protein, unknown function [Plasmodium vinckei vinckei]
MNSVFSIKPFIFALIICCQYYQHEANKSDHIFKGRDATITLSSRINRLLSECEAPPSTNPLSSHRRKEKEFNTESQKGDLEININENDIVNLENYIEENMNNNNMNDNDDDGDDDNDEVEFEEEGYSANYRTYSKRDHLIGDHKKNPKYFLGINKKKIKKYVTNMNMQAGFVGPTAFGVSYPIHQGLYNNKFAPADALNYWLTGSSFVYVFHLIRNAFFNTRKVNI